MGTVIATLIRGMVSAFILAAVFILWPPTYALAAEPVGSVVSVSGRAEIYRGGEGKGESIRPGTAVYQNDRVKTETGANLRIRFVDGSVISVAANSVVVIDRYIFQPAKKVRESKFLLVMGKIKCFANDLAGYRKRALQVQTATAVIGVRGTVFVVWQVDENTTIAAPFENEIMVAGLFDPAKVVIVQPETMSTILGGALPTSPVPVDPGMFQQLHEGLPPGDSGLTPGDGAEGGGDVTAATIAEAAVEALEQGVSLEVVIKDALTASEMAGIPCDELALKLGGALLEAGMNSGRDGYELAGQVVSTMVNRLEELGQAMPEALRATNQLILGLGAAGQNRGLDAATLRASLGSALAGSGAYGITEEMAAGIVAGVFRTLAETYTSASGPTGGGGTPPSPPNIPGGIQSGWGSSASPH